MAKCSQRRALCPALAAIRKEAPVNVGESGFTFNGRHTSNYGFTFVEKDGRYIRGNIQRNEYEISGRSGTVLMDGAVREPFTISGTLYPISEPETVQDAIQQARLVTAWLSAGRGKLILDDTPHVYYMAQLDKAPTWSTKNWFGGELSISFTVQPWAHCVNETSMSIEAEEVASIAFNVGGSEPTPLRVTVQNIGAAAITGVQVTLNGKRVKLAGMEIKNGSTLVIDMEEPIGATIDGTVNALPFASAFDLLDLPPGLGGPSIQLTYTANTTSQPQPRRARVTASARGRY